MEAQVHVMRRLVHQRDLDSGRSDPDASDGPAPDFQQVERVHDKGAEDQDTESAAGCKSSYGGRERGS